MKENITPSFSQKAARASWIVPFATFMLTSIVKTALQKTNVPLPGMIIAFVTVVLLAGGAILGIIGCFGVKEHSAKTTLVPGLIGTALNVAFLAVILSVASTSFTSALKQSTQAIADAVNKNLPIMADSEVRVDKVVALGERLLEYKNTLVHAEKQHFDTDSFVSTARPKLVAYYTTNDEFKSFREKNISVKFSYYDKHGELIASFVVPEEQAAKQ